MLNLTRRYLHNCLTQGRVQEFSLKGTPLAGDTGLYNAIFLKNPVKLKKFWSMGGYGVGKDKPGSVTDTSFFALKRSVLFQITRLSCLMQLLFSFLGREGPSLCC